MSGSPPRAVTFDFWNTIFAPSGDWAEARCRRIREFVREAGVLREDLELDELMARAVKANDESWRGGRQFGAPGLVALVLAELELNLDERRLTALRELVEDPRPELDWAPVPGVERALSELRNSGVRVGIVSDTGFSPGRVLRRQLERAGLAGFFEPAGMAFSDEVGVPKPNHAIFAAALAGLEAAPLEAAHVGDLRFTDVAGSRAMGMLSIRFRGCWDDPGPGPEADAVIGDYAELPAALGL